MASANSGALVLWDLSHSGGALPVDLNGCNADFAVGCTYKFLNAGPGSPAFLYVAPRLVGQAEPVLSGWFAHETSFAFDTQFRPMPGRIERMRVGTPSIAAFVLPALTYWTGMKFWLQQRVDTRLAAGHILPDRLQQPNI